MLSFWHYDLRRSSASCVVFLQLLRYVMCFVFFSPHRNMPEEIFLFISFACKAAKNLRPSGSKLCCLLSVVDYLFPLRRSSFLCYTLQLLNAARKKSRRAPAGHHQHKIECNFPSSSLFCLVSLSRPFPHHFISRRSTVCLNSSTIHMLFTILGLVRCVDTLFREGNNFH